MSDDIPNDPAERGRAPAKGGIIDAIANVAVEAYSKAGRGTLDLSGLKGDDIDIKGVSQDGQGREMSKKALTDAVVGVGRDGLDPLLGIGADKEARELAQPARQRGPDRER